jgi:cytochrome c-type biogenesis protein CcmH
VKRVRRAWLLMAVLFACTMAHAIEPLPFRNDAERVRFQHLTQQLRCMVCQNEDLYDSNADLARDMRLQIFRMMQAGKSDEEIKRYLVERYSDFVLYKPPLKPRTWLLWFGPALILVLGGIGVTLFVKRRTCTDTPVAVEGDEDW